MIGWLRRYQRGTSETLPWPEGIMEFDEHRDALPEQVYHDAARHFLDVQISTYDLLDTRAVQTFSIGSVVLPVTFALLNLGSTQGDIPILARWALGAALSVYLGLLFCVIQASTIIRGLEYRPNLEALREHSTEYPGNAPLRWVANEYEESSRENARVLTRKGRWVGFANIALYIEGVLLSSAAIMTLLL